jgi:MFS family permease
MIVPVSTGKPVSTVSDLSDPSLVPSDQDLVAVATTRRSRLLRDVIPVRLLPALAAGGVLYFMATLVAQHLLRPAYDPVTTFISSFVLGRYGTLLVGAFFAFGIGVLCLAVALSRTMRPTLWLRAGIGLLAWCGITAVVAGVFHTDLQGGAATIGGVIHGIAADSGYIALVGAMFALSLHFWRDERWHRLFAPSLALAVLGLLLLVELFFTLDTVVAGLAQRLFGLPVFVWLLVVSLRLMWMGPHADDGESPSLLAEQTGTE